MLSRLREHFGTAGLVVAIVALVAALGGGAIAATGGSDGKATASAKGKQGPRGKTGKTAPQGPAVPAGPQGPAGPKGDTGAAGSNGSDGAKGATGAAGATGATGATGKNGVDGKTGFTETLPSEMTETGTWQFTSNGEEVQFVPISFPIPLSAEAAASITMSKVNAGGEPTENCPGSPNEPKAKPGILCIYVAPEGLGSNFFGGPSFVYKPDHQALGLGTSGAFLEWEGSNAGTGKFSSGSFAITAP